MKFDFNENEYDVYRYLLKKDISDKSADAIAKELFVSRTTIYRVCNKMGYKSFSHFKFSKESENEKKQIYEVDIKGFLEMIQEGDMEKVLDEIILADRIFILATQATCIASTYMARQLLNLGYFAMAVKDEFEFAELKKLFKKNDLVICISNSGENRLIIKNIKTLKTKVLSLTKKDSSLKKISDYSISFDFTDYKEENSFDRENLFPIFMIIQKILINLKEI